MKNKLTTAIFVAAIACVAVVAVGVQLRSARQAALSAEAARLHAEQERLRRIRADAAAARLATFADSEPATETVVAPTSELALVADDAPAPVAAAATAPPERARSTAPAAERSGPLLATAEPIVPEPVAREALAYVGANPDAEVVWFMAINDPALSGHARQDLIENLNEVGYSADNGKRATIDDLPLVIARLRIIEELGPDAMDDVNAAAFMEAYKDLVNIYLRLTGR